MINSAVRRQIYRNPQQKIHNRKTLGATPTTDYLGENEKKKNKTFKVFKVATAIFNAGGKKT